MTMDGGRMPGPNPDPNMAVTLSGNVYVGQLPDGRRALIIDVSQSIQYTIPFDDDSAQIIGRGLLAPGLHIPKPGEVTL
jgi:hypothetical protein